MSTAMKLREEDKREGRLEGINEGITKGKIEGKTETAKAFLKEGIPIAVISRCTGLTEEQITAIK